MKDATHREPRRECSELREATAKDPQVETRWVWQVCTPEGLRLDRQVKDRSHRALQSMAGI